MFLANVVVFFCLCVFVLLSVCATLLDCLFVPLHQDQYCYAVKRGRCCCCFSAVALNFCVVYCLGLEMNIDVNKCSWNSMCSDIVAKIYSFRQEYTRH